MGKRDVDVTVKGHNKASGAFKSAAADVDSFGGRIKGLLNPVNLLKGGLASLGVLGFGALGKKAVESANDSEAAWARVESAVDNAGLTFGRFRGELDELFTSIQQTTRYSDDKAADAFASLMSITQDYTGSVKNLTLATNIAAAKKIDLVTAAELVGKAAIGETAALKKQGIIIKEGADAIEELGKRFSGFAERDAATMQGQLLQVASAWDNVLESMGRAILGMGGAGETTSGLASTLNQLATWIDANRTGIYEFADGAKNLATWLLKITGIGSALAGAIEGYDKLFTVIAQVAGYDQDGPEDAGSGQYYKDLGRIRARAKQRAQAELDAAKEVRAGEALRDAQNEITKKAIASGGKFKAAAAGPKYDAKGEDMLLRLFGAGELTTPQEFKPDEFRLDPSILAGIADGAKDAKFAIDDLGMSIDNVKSGAIMAMADTWSDAVEAIVTGSAKAGAAIGRAIRKGVGSGMIAEGRQNILAAGAIAVKGLFNPVDWGRAAKLFGIGTLQISTGSLFAGGGGGGGGGGGVGATGFAQQQNEIGGRAGGTTFIIDGKEFNTADPRVEESLAEALRDVLSRNVVIVPAGG